MNHRSVASLAGLALGAVFLLGLVFILLPWPWNVAPLALLAVTLLALGNRLRLPPVPEEAAPAAPQEEAVGQDEGWGRRANRAFGPVVAGMILDVVDLATFGPIGLFLGLPVGGLVGYWMGSALGLRQRARLWCALAGGIYCTIPGTEFIPLGTLVGAFARFRESGRTPRRRRSGRARSGSTSGGR